MDESAPSLNTIDCTFTGQNFFRKGLERDLSNSRSQAVMSPKSNTCKDNIVDSLIDKSNIELSQTDVNLEGRHIEGIHSGNCKLFNFHC